MDPVNIPAKFDVRITLPIPEINRGYFKNLGSPWIRQGSLFSQIFKGFLFAWTLWNTSAKYEVRSFTRSWDNRGHSKKFGPSLDTPTLPFLQNFSWFCVRMDPVNVSAKYAVRSFRCSWDNSDWSFGVGLWTPNLGEEEAVGVGMTPFERALVISIGSP